MAKAQEGMAGPWLATTFHEQQGARMQTRSPASLHFPLMASTHCFIFYFKSLHQAQHQVGKETHVAEAERSGPARGVTHLQFSTRKDVCIQGPHSTWQPHSRQTRPLPHCTAMELKLDTYVSMLVTGSSSNTGEAAVGRGRGEGSLSLIGDQFASEGVYFR